ncbi:HAMP domain-containing sensor histidine kinase [Imperialibacter roseus]|uniref:histidine kinase n=1 Tax=Imperialibacter roseus TaxID=1324217 RepID=A0ABZ0IU97_9BACT|nr:HAMP domain-containing sensor histidine kinase [Imperialibacter roseus]WOK08625.1 HAMP domain-containing sensor histidine kinase [Imperialibacter roseus]
MIILKRSYLLVVLLTCLVLLGWVADIEFLKGVLPGLETMKPITAFCFLLCVAAIHFGGFTSIVGMPFVFIISGMHLIEVIAGRMLFPEISSIVLRMSGATSFLFMAISLAIGMSEWKSDRATVRTVELILLAGLFICFTALLGFILDYESLHRVTFFSTMAIHTAICFMLIYGSFLLSQISNKDSRFHLVFSKNLGGRVILRRWLVTITIPAVASGTILLGAIYDFYDIGFAFILLASFSSAFTTIFLFRKARVIETIDLENQRLLYEKQKINEDLEILNEAINVSKHELEIKNKELVKAVEALYKKNRELDLFTYHTSHDIRAPVASILGIAAIAMSESDIEKMKEYFRVIEGRGKRLDKFIHQMIMFTRNDRTALELERINVEEVLDDCLNDIRVDPLYRGLKVEKQIMLDNPVMIFDRIRLGEIFGNILHNAIKFQNTQVAESYLKIAVMEGGDYLRIIFEDNGIGIKKEYQPKLFQMFQRATDQVEGSGLGLYIVKQMVTKLGGNIKLTSEYGKGTKIEIDLAINKLQFNGNK